MNNTNQGQEAAWKWQRISSTMCWLTPWPPPPSPTPFDMQRQPRLRGPIVNSTIFCFIRFIPSCTSLNLDDSGLVEISALFALHFCLSFQLFSRTQNGAADTFHSAIYMLGHLTSDMFHPWFMTESVLHPVKWESAPTSRLAMLSWESNMPIFKNKCRRDTDYATHLHQIFG